MKRFKISKQKKNNHRAFKGFLLFVLLSVAACAVIPERKPRGIVLSTERRDGLLEVLKRREGQIRSLKGLADVRLKTFGEKGQFPMALVLQRPSSFRVDSLSDLGIPRFQFAASRGEFSIYWPGENLYFQGFARRENLGRFLSLPLEPESAILILSGAVPLEEGGFTTLREISWEGQGEVTLLLKGPAGEILLGRQGDQYVPLQYSALDWLGERDYRVTYKGYELRQGYWFPGEILIQSAGTDIHIHYREVEINSPVDAKLFRPNLPRDARRIED